MCLIACVLRVRLSFHTLCVSVCYVADYKRGFGGQYGVEVERQDQCALGYEHKESLAKHESQKGTETPPPEHDAQPRLSFPKTPPIFTHPFSEKRAPS